EVRWRAATDEGSGLPAPAFDLLADGLRVLGQETLVPAFLEGEEGHLVDRGLVARGGDEVVEGGREVRVGQGALPAVPHGEPVGGGHGQLDVAARVAGRAPGEGREVRDGGGQAVLLDHHLEDLPPRLLV